MGQLLAFSKYEGTANDFVIVDGRSADLALAAKHAAALCDRHRGVGADGVLLVEAAAPGAFAMRVINADGSRPEMCGNGIRCVALYLVQSGAAGEAEFDIDTDSGPHRCRVFREGGQDLIEVSMRAADLDPVAVPVQAQGPVLDEIFEADGKRVRLSCVSMGNPHGVTFDDVGEGARRTLGPALEKHPRFARGANIGFARMLGPNRIELAVWERGVGFTQACGTGACACAVAAVETGRANRGQPIDVELSGGILRIVVPDAGERIRMSGPARRVFSGQIEL